MTSEEMAEEWVMNNSKNIINRVSNGETNMFGVAEQAFLAGLKVREDQLTKATEIIKELVWVEYADFTNGDYSNELSKVLEQAEQFLSEERK